MGTGHGSLLWGRLIGDHRRLNSVDQITHQALRFPDELPQLAELVRESNHWLFPEVSMDNPMNDLRETVNRLSNRVQWLEERVAILPAGGGAH